MKPRDTLRNQLKATRNRLGLSQQELATAAGVSRQAIGGIETGLYSASAAVALRLAKALGCRVEDIFWLEDDLPTVAAELVDDTEIGASTRVSLVCVDGRWLARPLVGEGAFRTEMIPADGVCAAPGDGNRVAVRALDELETLKRTVSIAGCAPSLSLWTRSAERWYPGVRIDWVLANSTEALNRLARREIHIAGVHLCNPVSGEESEPFVRRLMPHDDVVLVNFGVWEEGLLVAPGNPKRIAGIPDLARPDLRFVNREPGAGSRLLVDALLGQAGIAGNAVSGYRDEVRSHREVARAIALGHADLGASTASVASAYGLAFVPLRRVRYDLVLRKENFEREPIQQLLTTLSHRWVRAQLQVVGGYDTSRTGEVVALLEGR